MPQKTSHNLLVLLAIGLSIMGAFMPLPLALYSPTARETNIWWKPVIGSFLALICLFGIFIISFPERCSKNFHPLKTGELAISEAENSAFHATSISFKGHHPDCGNYSAHVICIDGRVFCAACTGLFLGALIVLAGTILYFFVGWNFFEFGLWSVLVGQVGVDLGFFQFKFRGYARLVVNTFFVVANFLILAGVDALAQNAFIDLYLVALILFWLFTRILVSQWDHWRICHTCELRCRLK
ncbi:MAG: hypothetical protein QXZ25_04115 [Candidatus Bathyarchaeia archaeon]